MNSSDRLEPMAARLLPALVVVAVPLAVFLAFAIQPVFGKQLVPVYGGTGGTWSGCMVYFQLSVLLGYGWAAWLARKPLRFQVNATVLLAVLAVLTFRLPVADPAAASLGRVVWRLAVASLPAMMLLFATAPLLHGWLRRRGDGVPYYLHALASAGALAAVLLYPFLIEPNLRLSEQTFFWHGLLLVLAGALATIGLLLSLGDANAAAPAEDFSIPPRPRAVAATLWLGALTCAGMLAATQHLAVEIGSNPVAWAGPFAAYLLGFMVAFSGRWRRWMTLVTLAWLAVSLSGFMLAKGFTAATVNGHRAWWLFSLTASGSFLGHALLHGLRPAARQERFYLVLAAGGAIGGATVGAIVPHVLAQPVEFALISAALLSTGIVWLIGRREAAVSAIVATVILVPVVGLGWNQVRQQTPPNSALRHFRDLYGHAILKTDARSVVLSTETTTRGTQLTFDDAARRHPTLYDSESSGVGRTIERLQAARPKMSVAVIGVGAGTLAAYARAGDTYDFWDVDPNALAIARESFSYIANSAGRINLIAGDGRKALEESKTDYDLIVIDAFAGCGDTMPEYLLTREALAIYLRRLGPKDGLLLVHASTRYSNFFPVVEATARTVGRSAILVVTDISASTPERDWDATRTDYIVVCRLEQMKRIEEWFPIEEDQGRVKRAISTIQSNQIPIQQVWSDGRSAATDTLDLSRFLLEP
ncbi:MAG TPA: hypothetical protein VHD62_05900 [Opitutaceae bacterium]|nr:hypothetical protein [Opitutaceae bacterium]